MSKSGNDNVNDNCNLFMNADNSDYIVVHINHDPSVEYQFVNHVVYVTRLYKGVDLDKQFYKFISLLAISKYNYTIPPTLKYKSVLLLIKKI